VLPDDACPNCGTTMKEARGRLFLPINGEQVSVPSAAPLQLLSGRNVQTAAMDILLRLIRDLPGRIDYLRDHAARFLMVQPSLALGVKGLRPRRLAAS
jgi:hypothetical protein